MRAVRLRGMPRLVSRLLLSMLVVPYAGMFFAFAAIVTEETIAWRYGNLGGAICGGATWLFMVVYWWLLWRKSVLWTRFRTYRTAESSAICAAAGAALGYIMAGILGATAASGVGAAFAAFVWMGWTTVIWRHTREEAGKMATVCCFECGYNMAGLKSTICPECGAALTLEELLSRQRSEETRALKEDR